MNSVKTILILLAAMQVYCIVAMGSLTPLQKQEFLISRLENKLDDIESKLEEPAISKNDHKNLTNEQLCMLKLINAENRKLNNMRAQEQVPIKKKLMVQFQAFRANENNEQERECAQKQIDKLAKEITDLNTFISMQ